MKLKGLITLTSLMGAISPTLCLVGCSHFKPIPEPIDDSAKDYIYDRTFSIMASGRDKDKPQLYDICWGTAWIIDDATPDVKDDYSYWIASNWHVKRGMEDVNSQTLDCVFSYGRGDNLSWKGDYTEFKSINWEAEMKFLYGQLEGGIDFEVADVNFGSSSTIPGDIKESLDRLNVYRQSHNHITEVTDAWTTTSTYEENRTYVGGYPVHRENAKWEYHCIDENWLNSFNLSEQPHYIIDGYLPDISPQYTMKDEYKRLSNWMDGGASGSMLVTKIDNEFKVMGVYWGGFLPDKDSSEFLPSFSIFNSTYKNFISDYLK